MASFSSEGEASRRRPESHAAFTKRRFTPRRERSKTAQLPLIISAPVEAHFSLVNLTGPPEEPSRRAILPFRTGKMEAIPRRRASYWPFTRRTL